MIVEKLDNQGRGIIHHENTIIFINNALPLEEITLCDVVTHKKFKVASSKEITNPNINRVVPKCPYYEACGGCNIMHMNYESQLDFKLNKVKGILKKYCNLEPDIRMIKNNQQLFYRNKVILKISNNSWGYYNQSTHNFKEITTCLLADNTINDIIENKNLFNIKNGEITLRSNIKKEILISIKTSEPYSIDYKLLSKNIVGIVINNKCVYGNNYFYDEIGNYQFRVSYNSFFQVNNYIASCIFEILNNNMKGTHLLDLYCGVGTLGISLASKYKSVVGIEKIANAIIDAKENARINNLNNIKFYTGDTGKILNNLKISIDSIIVDPPRSGLNKETIDHLLNIKPKLIAYISCDPMTLARDLNILKENYYIKKMNVLDMFSNTFHVECVCVLERR